MLKSNASLAPLVTMISDEETNTLILDGGHNEQAGRSLAEYLEKIKGKRSIYLVFAMINSKDLKAYLSNFSSLVTEIKCFKLRENFYETKRNAPRQFP